MTAEEETEKVKAAPAASSVSLPAQGKVDHDGKGRFWGALLGTALLTMVGSGTITGALNNSKDEDTKKVVKTESKKADDALELKFQTFLNEEFQTGLEEYLDAREDALLKSLEVELDHEFNKLEKQCQEALVEAKAASKLAELDWGRRKVEREKAAAKAVVAPPSTEGPPEPHVTVKKDRKKPKRNLPMYQQEQKALPPEL